MNSDGDLESRIAVCFMFLASGEWRPHGASAKITAHHRSTPDGPVVLAELIALVSASDIVSWRDPSFLKLEVFPSGEVEEIDIAEAMAAIGPLSPRSSSSDVVVSLGSRRAPRTPRQQDWKPTPPLMDALYRKAEEMIARKVAGVRQVGVIIVPSKMSISVE